jgi:thiamine phosphate synthase YjbQ (UPF0047 family)
MHNPTPIEIDRKMQQTIRISTPSYNGLYDITRQVESIVSDSGVKSGMVNVLQILRYV